MSQWRAASGGTGTACNQTAGGGWLPPPTLDPCHGGSVEVSQGVLRLVRECSLVVLRLIRDWGVLRLVREYQG